jgi:transcriptional regulator with XRE-family HTH domain
MAVPQTLGERLKQAIRNKGWTQVQAARHFGISPVSLSRYVTDERDPGEELLDRMARELGVLTAYLRYGTRIYEQAPYPTGRMSEASRTPYATATRKLPSRVREHLYRYLDQLEQLSVPDEEVEEVERLMAESTFSKLHVHDARERTEDELIMDIDAAWDFVRYVMRKRGVNL